VSKNVSISRRRLISLATIPRTLRPKSARQVGRGQGGGRRREARAAAAAAGGGGGARPVLTLLCNKTHSFFFSRVIKSKVSVGGARVGRGARRGESRCEARTSGGLAARCQPCPPSQLMIESAFQPASRRSPTRARQIPKMTPRLLAVLIAALATAVGFGVGIGVGAAIWEGGSSSPSSPATSATSDVNTTASWLFVVTADAGVVTATGGDALTIELRGTAPQSLGFTDRPARQARAWPTPSLWKALYVNGSAPPNGALSFEHAGEAVLLPVEMLNVTGAAPNYTIAARALGEGGVEHLGAALEQRPETVVRGAGDPLWAELRAGLKVTAPSFFIDKCVIPSRRVFPHHCAWPPGISSSPRHITSPLTLPLPRLPSPPLGAVSQRVS
jgi:hypothetical protein